MAYSVVRTDNLHSTDVRANGCKSILFYNGDSKAAIENGNVAKISNIIAGEREVYKAVAPSANTALKDIVLVADPEVNYDPLKRNLDDYIVEAGKIARGCKLHSGDFFGVTIDGLAGKSSPEVGDLVELQAGTKLKVVASATSGSTQVGKIAFIETAGKYTYYVVEVA